jgi:hypothetical protein
MMLKTFALTAAVALCSAAPAWAESACQEPIAPAAVDGNTATADQLHMAVLDVKTFIKQSDDYQDCLWKELKDQQDAAKRDKKDLDPSAAQGVQDKVKSNQALKERVGNEYNAAATTYKAKHPGS